MSVYVYHSAQVQPVHAEVLNHNIIILYNIMHVTSCNWGEFHSTL